VVAKVGRSIVYMFGKELELDSTHNALCLALQAASAALLTATPGTEQTIQQSERGKCSETFVYSFHSL